MQSDEKIGLIIHGPTGIRLRYWRVTDLNAVTKKKVCALAKDIIRDKLTRWRFFYSGKCHVTNHSGKTMHFKNIGFEGTPRHVFWNGFVEPFLEDAIEQVLESTAERCRKYDLEPEPYIDEAVGLLWNFLIEKAYYHMVETERILQGKGCPKGPRGVITEDVKDKMRNMHRVLEEHRKAAMLIAVGEKHVQNGKPAETEHEATPAKRLRIWTFVKRIPRWIYVLFLFLAALLTCLYYLGWLEPIKTFIYNILQLE